MFLKLKNYLNYSPKLGTKMLKMNIISQMF